MSHRPYSTSAYREAARALAAIGRRIYGQGWSPATSSNYSLRLNEDHAAITRSGRDKGLLEETDIMVVDMEGAAVGDGKPSAETLLHTQLYRRLPDCGAVLHTHSHASTVLTMHWPADHITLEGYELLKALDGVQTHDTRLTIPVFENSQDIAALAAEVDRAMDAGDAGHAYLIRGHGLYTWAADIGACYRQLEALETLLAVELDRRRLG
ncbi:MAG TPA: methylthioribulose 1-phosphate dehydratase [Alcanivorax sp.]|jgi:methylthioribulose-1-phosphate dehydratase|uniref:Methylthioribulose-1-phosphate dehydratase n=1 Tax=Alloalcanivorax venustensis ISO4 TaxID=1177184 RepID=A0ABS0ALF9_9GAMM|nr:MULTISPECIES: methylthioribulose 1-phosphate dehydratase [Gammaproteobacteria]MAD70627.1 methylthioribulose-1-phosphate dehydratase [Alcanivorax sp.]MEA3261091.1 methylthioribulose 1-phosphate dehydratase [Pseudomonadota bacterium]SMO93042.1 methylthioribulose-1-phosphate dehydratase [Alcanivorax sp. DSM 26295]MAK20893.1 methylthioribulose-1-phosphate dehydratase [Alcanivorax sp.]MBF5054336.1 sugar aldolase [Alloalcanivorax venustensis ISO4]|tara:strand:- start:14416 stop:15045 length:630 start_codon:yes stop_codon:yes gene_type:complete